MVKTYIFYYNMMYYYYVLIFKTKKVSIEHVHNISVNMFVTKQLRWNFHHSVPAM